MSWDWNWLTPLGHVAVVWPLLVAMAALLVVRPGGSANLRGVSIWLGSMATASLLVAASKIAFYGWGTGIRAWNLTCFSGHSVMAMGFWPVALTLIAPTRFSTIRRISWATGALIGVLVGISRVKVNAHPGSEVIAGLALGLAVATCSSLRLRQRCIDSRTAMLAIVMIVPLVVWSGARLFNPPTERWFENLGISLSGRDEPYQRYR